MKKEEIIKWLAIMKANLNSFPEVSSEKKIEALAEAIRLLKIEESEEPRWIPVSERLPEENKTVIASTKYGVYSEARYTKEDGWEWAYESGADYWVELEYVTAWMPLPKAYREV